VLRSGDRVRVTAQLIRASTDRHLWAGNFERDVRDVVALQDEVALTIAKQIGAGQEGPPPAAAAAMTARVSPEGYEAYLKGTYYLDRWDLQKSIEYFNQAIKLEPGFAAPYARMARAYFYLAFFGALTPHEGCGKAKQAAEAAIERDPTLPEAHGTLALVKLHYDWDFVGAEKEFKRALELNPSDADVRHDYAHHLMALGRVQESQQESRRAVQLDPIGSALTSCLCWHSFAARDYDQAVDLAMKYLRAQPDDAFEHTILGWSYEQKKLYPEAVKEFSRAVELAPGDAFFQAPLGHGYAVAGRTADAEKVLNDLIQRRKKAYVSAFDIALIKAGLGKKDEAFGWLDRAAQEHSIFLVYSKWEPRLDPLRSDPRFEALLKRVGLS
jgi:tetratricopeptide (TPR) repeat protein